MVYVLQRSWIHLLRREKVARQILAEEELLLLLYKDSTAKMASLNMNCDCREWKVSQCRAGTILLVVCRCSSVGARSSGVDGI
jgi:hypothetical protein